MGTACFCTFGGSLGQHEAKLFWGCGCRARNNYFTEAHACAMTNRGLQIHVPRAVLNSSTKWHIHRRAGMPASLILIALTAFSR
jgi:hypothetical protein